MGSYARLNNVVGWLVFAVATVVYLLTLEPTASFWDCGEFIACSYKLLVPHPPGAPLFLLLGRLFSLLSFGDTSKVAVLINTLSALSSAFAVLFLFWSITLLAAKLVLPRPTPASPALLVPTRGQALLMQAAGVVGALAFAFSDSFWFNAEEAEVYAMSALCTAAVVWLMLKWENRADEPDSDKWLVLIAYVIGLSIGVHLLNLVAIPALGLLYYHRRQPAPTLWGSVVTLLISSVIVGVVLVGVIPGLPSLAGSFEVFFVNSLGMPFNSGVVGFVVLLLGLLVLGFRVSHRQNARLLNTALLGFTFILIGYSCYLIVPIRSGYQPTINQNGPRDVLSFVSYLKREQYGSRPLLYGPHVFAQPIAQEDAGPRYVREGSKYVVAEQRQELIYRDEDKMLLPRLYSDGTSSASQRAAAYRQWVDIQEGVKPTMGQNLAFLLRYQMGHMFWRYFLWNYVGRESDVQHAGVLWPTTSHEALPERVADSKARNNFLALPLLLGVLGLVYQVRRDPRNALVVGLLFLFTGLAIIVYLNQPPLEPRERDYTFTGATYAFAIWIGLGVLALAEVLRWALKADTARAAVALLLGLIVPGIMLAEGWDDHDRSDRFTSVDAAKNLLNSCAPNAILFTNGDNDTFPLWYAQEVEGIRTDVRVAVLSYLNTDWYIRQMTNRAYKSQPLPISLPAARYRQGTNDYLPYVENPNVSSVNLHDFIGLVKANSDLLKVSYGDGSPTLLSFPSPRFYLPVDTTAVKQLGIIPPGRRGQLVPQMEFNIGKGAMEKRNLFVLDILATNQWKRPVYFATSVARTEDHLGLDAYFQLEGLAWRVLPLKNPNDDPREEAGYLAKDLLYQKLMQQFTYRGLNNPAVFHDENSQMFPANYRAKFARLANAYLAAGDTATAKKLADKCLAVMPDRAIPYDFYTPQLLPALTAGGESKRANQLFDLLLGRAQRALTYYSNPAYALFDRELSQQLATTQQLYLAAQQIGDERRANQAFQLLQPYLRQ
ncbi:glycosyltransferase family 117 protein [Hymenobacter canadensis]|uniref:DUF2723 domain-containing protein n=1 Tax=Hymenobacter canadensis TaxID=2999067 RepID=A0ABY7LM21_9BACT|nr:DUF2723 domain-containing protein [Hymenobacter canadensis]WBA40962.1 DUF2723 domain-containing protein [Hymenobacter canadensis]